MLLSRLAALDACIVSDALDFVGLSGATIGIKPLWPCARIVGRAITVQAGAKSDSKPTHHMNTTAIAAGGSESVLVIANNGREDVSCWGDIVSNAALVQGIRGVVIDGACRDIEASEELGFPVFGKAVVPISARNRIVQVSSGEPIQCAGVAVRQGDYVIADQSGTVFVPLEAAEQVIELGERIARKQSAMVAAVRAGRSVVDVMHDSEFDQIMKVQA